MRMGNASVGNASADTMTTNNTSANNTRADRARVSKPGRADLAGRHVAALGLAIVSLTASERAAAECTPQPPDNKTVICTGTTQNNPTGYGTETDTGNTIKVQSGASVTGDRLGLVFKDGTVVNRGTISAGAEGVGITSSRTAIVRNFSSGTISG